MKMMNICDKKTQNNFMNHFILKNNNSWKQKFLVSDEFLSNDSHEK